MKINLLVEPGNAGVVPFYERLGFHPRSMIFMDKWIAALPGRPAPGSGAGDGGSGRLAAVQAVPPTPGVPAASGWTGIQPALHPEPYVFVTVPEPPTDLEPFAFIRENEGVTLVVTRGQADQAGLPYQYLAARVTLTIGSALSAVGLTAAVSRVLASAGISCNVIAGFHHDHLFVDWDRGADAATLLRQL